MEGPTSPEDQAQAHLSALAPERIIATTNVVPGKHYDTVEFTLEGQPSGLRLQVRRDPGDMTRQRFRLIHDGRLGTLFPVAPDRLETWVTRS